ncbi:Interleukin-1 receptor-associated kinase 4 [Mizuhopecten yessoensis]|uniref:non-specific serine/threonine protein kinase n=2 Tax=Mizuhopecten yessoensis TaxID=6573 RepID=A0A210R5E9_MIZYE|nr:Interleukin-1 receptor-associated kinase 4 [Mizuhopecten yessoensis]
MAGKKKLTQDSYIRSLPYSALRFMAMHLDTDNRWKLFATFVPRKLTPGAEFQERYSTLQIDMFEVRGRHPGASPTLLILNDWATQNAQLKHLLEVFQKAKMYIVADYLLDQMDQKKIANVEEWYNGNNPDSTVSSLGANLSSMKVTQDINDDPKMTLYNKPKLNDSDFASESMSSSGSEMATSCAFTSKPSADCEAANYVVGKSLSNMGDQLSCQPACQFPTREESKHSSIGSPSLVGKNDSQGLHPSQVGKNDASLQQASQVCTEETPRQCFCTSSREISYTMLQNFTRNFAELDVSRGGNMIGCGGFGVVFIAESPHGCKAAVKQLRHPGDPLMEKQFQTELEKLSKFRHENIVSLLGYSVDGSKKCLVYDYMPNGSLEERLCCFRKTEPLPWKRRLEIVTGTARGIVFLNSQGEVHRDIKSANVLLDENFVPKVGDFATVRTGPSGSSTTAMETMQVIGTSAYMAPEAIRFDVSAKLDSFAFGVVLLEVLTGLSPNDPRREEADLWSYVQETCDDNESIKDLLDKSAGDWNVNVAIAVFVIAQKCLHDKKKKRVLVADILPDLEQFIQTCCSDTFV